jgi:hypothetical protein
LDFQNIDPLIEEIIGDKLPRLDDPNSSIKKSIETDLLTRGGCTSYEDFYKVINPKPLYFNDLGYK